MKNSERKDELYGPVAININVVLFHSLHVIDSIINKTFGEWPTFWKTLTIKMFIAGIIALWRKRRLMLCPLRMRTPGDPEKLFPSQGRY